MTAPNNFALAIIDMQNDFVLPGATACVAGAQATLPALRRLLDQARAEGWAVIHVTRSHRADGSDVELFRRDAFSRGQGICVAGTKGADIVQELAPAPGEYRLSKLRFSAFLFTEFDALLRRLGVETLVLAGTQYPNCIRATAVDAMARDYRTIVVTNACSAQTPEVAEHNIFDLSRMGVFCVDLAGLPALLAAP
ncbi:MAG: isochorismatase family cysteine hydrolase [Humidesulfovibrio sp.]|uniref:cysteine hydrolase family protein n=1 Tax=Humidesulfovibrio sp. TaxID=2910988 RepID=UPI0027331401|nr:isochorismatase family cysteine hydrolase [Humidesulfovibrio sp.]MDP2848967.1 isochorismatase family cysteine hydrolase [Humidesulfovibrio sp.]